MSKLTMLEKYQLAFADIAKQISPAAIDAARTCQELLYRIEVLQVCQMFNATAPIGDDRQAMFKHYQMVDIYLANLVQERHNGLAAASEAEEARRGTVYQSLGNIVDDYRKCFRSFRPESPDQYKREIGKAIIAFLTVWIQMRNTYINIATKETAA